MDLASLIGTVKAILVNLIVAAIAFFFGRWWQRKDERRKNSVPIADDLRKIIPQITESIKKDFFYHANMQKLKEAIGPYKDTQAHVSLPKDIRDLLAAVETCLDDFAKISLRLRKELRKHYEQLPTKGGGGGPDEVVATELVFMPEDQLPNKEVPINFPQESLRAVSQGRANPEQLRSIRDAVRNRFSVKEYADLKTRALGALEELDRALLKLQKG